MSWTIERRGRVAAVTMTTNPVNAQNRADLHDAFDRLERDHADSPVALTGTGRRFSAGLDLGEHFPIFAGDPAGVPAPDLVDRAVAIAELTPEYCLGSCTFTKRACRAAALRDIAEPADPLDAVLPAGFTTDDARHAHRRQQLTGSPAPW